MKFVAINIFSDNFSYLFYNDEEAFCVDPAEPLYIIDALSKSFDKIFYHKDEISSLPNISKPRKLVYSFTTHEHPDHAIGDDVIQNKIPSSIHKSLYKNTFKDNETVSMTEGTTITCLDTPGHTFYSACFYVQDISGLSYILTGDTIFFLGCGKIFTENPEKMVTSLDRIVETVKPDTLFLYGHNYNKTNVKFTEKVFKKVPENIQNKTFLTLKEEIEFNPFLNLSKCLPKGTKVDKMIYLRKMKDEFNREQNK
ncbi:hydroxyacylglutathione hydrolase [Hamiltosporidium tvaerminnensis]|uniref:Hydroxyacylglutathione hydrolase n=2 Tax=Hamiltosporidium TaxID=1176354 RepID=A0A4Q9LDT2_9MICR|nr:Cytoplasmic glyoxalase II [Hamiltosporidium tvaerminnensis]TBU01316.1 hydroxyacylglutathione hydrolase [Hamiltosporidium tvaerminnensis]TBU06087.1 hydroxyacylglutathione hydrolase [Hamiltosporidium magnivora]